MAKQLIFRDEAHHHLQAGLDKTAQAVATTLGPKGRNVALDQGWGSPTITHDGVTVVREIEWGDRFENMGAQLLRAAAAKTNDIAGDGTTTATVLAQALVGEGLKNMAAGANPMLLKRGLEKATVVRVRASMRGHDCGAEPGNWGTDRRGVGQSRPRWGGDRRGRPRPAH